jgi:histidinol-phosphate aminotransferase
MHIPPYAHGLSKEEVSRQFGVEKPVKLASNENALGPSPQAQEVINDLRDQVHLYPDPTAGELRQAAARYFGCEADRIIAGNGSDEIIDLICRAFISPGDKVLIPELTFSYYKIASLACGAHIIHTAMDGMHIDGASIEQALNQRIKIVFIANPNNPTGTYLHRESIQRLVTCIPADTLLVIDEAYGIFSRASDFSGAMDLIEQCENLIIVHTLSKSHGLAGLRVGFGIATGYVLDKLYRIKPPFNLNLLAIKAGAAALSDSGFLKKTLQVTWDGLDYLYGEFARLGLPYVESQTNFVLVRIGKEAQRVYEELLKKGIITRHLRGKGLEEYIRISIGLPEENSALIANLEELLCR